MKLNVPNETIQCRLVCKQHDAHRKKKAVINHNVWRGTNRGHLSKSRAKHQTGEGHKRQYKNATFPAQQG